jgi:hypothetical protein
MTPAFTGRVMTGLAFTRMTEAVIRVFSFDFLFLDEIFLVEVLPF